MSLQFVEQVLVCRYSTTSRVLWKFLISYNYLTGSQIIKYYVIRTLICLLLLNIWRVLSSPHLRDFCIWWWWVVVRFGWKDKNQYSYFTLVWYTKTQTKISICRQIKVRISSVSQPMLVLKPKEFTYGVSFSPHPNPTDVPY